MIEADQARVDRTGRREPQVFAGHRLVAVFAHPDDESLAAGGLLSWCATLGAQVSLVCATRGEHGGGPSARDSRRTTLARVRESELRAAADALGAQDVVLLDHEDGMLPWVEPHSIETEIADIVRARGAEVVVTFDADGLYWHPDHVAIHERTTAAVAALSTELRASAPNAGGDDEDDAVNVGPALYYVSVPQGAMRGVVERAAQTGEGGQRHVLGIRDPDAFGAEAPAPTLVIDARRHASHKLRALKCHRSQMIGSALDVLTEQDARRWLAIEHYRRAPIGGPVLPFIEQLAHLGDSTTRANLSR